MKKGTKRGLKVLSFVLLLAMVFSVVALPSGFLASALSALTAPFAGDFTDRLDGVKIPFTAENPYHPTVSVGKLYPVFTPKKLGDGLSWIMDDEVEGYATHWTDVAGVTPWYTASVAPWYGYSAYALREGGEVTGTLPYREAREDMLHGDLTLINAGIHVSPINDLRVFGTGSSFREALDREVLASYGLNLSQLSLRARARLLSGSGSVSASTGGDADRLYSADARIEDGKAQVISVELPINETGTSTSILFESYDPVAEADAMMTDVGLFLVDGTAPSVIGMSVSREERENKTADLVLDMTFNETVRFARDDLESVLDEIWVELLLRDLETGKASTARLYLEEQTGTQALRFRGDIGEYNYRNYRIERVASASFATGDYYVERAYIDLADVLYESAYKTVDYGNRIQVAEEYTRSFDITAICDIAGNGVNLESITNWQFSNLEYISNTFEAGLVEIYNEYTLGRAEGQLSGKANAYEMMAGPDNELTVLVYIDGHLTEEEGRQVFIELNVKNADGTPVKVQATSVSDYRTAEEVYGNTVRTGTLLRFDGIKLTSDMTFDGATGADAEPRIQAVRMTSTIPLKTAFETLPESRTVIYADLDRPETAITLFGAQVHENEDGTPAYYTVSIKADAEDASLYKYNAGVLDTYATLYAGLDAGRDVSVRYTFGYGANAALPPADPSGYTEEATLTADGMLRAGSFKIINDPATCYLHLYIESQAAYINGLTARLHAADMAGNESLSDATVLDYLIDERPPSVTLGAITSEPSAGNDRITVTLDVNAEDPSHVQRLEYFVGNLTPDAQWSPLPITEGVRATATWSREYGGFDADTNRIYEETVWVRAADVYGNISAPVSRALQISLQKPLIDASPVTDGNEVSTAHDFRVKGAPAALLGGATAYTRVTLAPTGSAYVWMTLVATGEERNIFDFSDTVWYRVRLDGAMLAEVSAPLTVGASPVLDENDPMYALLSHYGEVRISLDAGYGDMIPVAGEALQSAANAGSYVAEESRYTFRFASPYTEALSVHGVDFGTLTDRTGEVVMADTDKGAAPYVFGAVKRTVNPMRNATFAYTVSNILRADFGLLDLDTENSYAELLYYANDGDAPVTVARVTGMTPTETQYFTVKNETDGGESFATGAYFLRVTVKSRSGHTSVFDSAVAVIDAEIGESAGVWKYDYLTVADPSVLAKYNAGERNPYAEHTHLATDAPFASLGVSVPATTGEKMRSGMLAVYSFGVETLWITLSTPDVLRTVAGVEVGRVEGYQIWNLASEPSEEDLARAPFRNDATLAGADGSIPQAQLHLGNGLSEIYSEDTLPKGISGIGAVHLMKGVNTICYRVRMANGYLSPVKQFTVNVSDEVPELNIALEDYIPSAAVSQQDGMVNAHSVRVFVEHAYSLNGNGEVNVQLWSDYGMTVGKTEGGARVARFLEDPTPQAQAIALLAEHLSPEDWAELTENTYTANFPNYNSLCTAVFAAIDEYGGVTFVAPQIGDHKRVDVHGGEYGWEQYDISYYGEYYQDPYSFSDHGFSWRVRYNEPSYFGRDLLGFATTLELENEPHTLLEVSNPSLGYNLFNIVTNNVTFDSRIGVDITHGGTAITVSATGKNIDLINPSDAWITVGGIYGGNEVTLPLFEEDNRFGYLGVTVSSNRLSLALAQPVADAVHPDGTGEERTVRVHGTNLSGQPFSFSTTVTVTYRTPKLTATMTESGVRVNASFFTAEYGDAWQTGIYENGTYPISLNDRYGGIYDLTYTVTDDAHPAVAVTKSNAAMTAQPVTVRLQSAYAITVNVTDYAVMTVTGNGSGDVTVLLSANTRFSFTYEDAEGNYFVGYINTDNIYLPAPQVVWSAGADTYSTDAESGEHYRYGEVTVWLTDAQVMLTDRYTGKIPSFTFTPGGATEYVFRAADIEAILGVGGLAERVGLTKDVKVTLPYTLRESPDPLEGDGNDTETPNLRVRAYANVGGVYSDRRVSLTLASANVSNAFRSTGAGYYDYRYVGGRANAFELLGAIGWGTDYRFAIDVADSSRVRLFVKAGLYNESTPDFETGTSDEIAGVVLQSRLLTVSKNAQFTLFAVDARGNVSQVAFDVTGLSDAPVPTLVKVPVSHDTVRVYILPPAEAGADFEILGTYMVATDNDPESAQYGSLYIELKDNDDFIINYRYEYMGEAVTGSQHVSVSEISLDEMTELGREYSENAADEATALDVRATVYFSHTIRDVLLTDTDAPVSITTGGNVLTLTYHENSPALTLTVRGENGTAVPVTLSAVENIDKSAPNVEEVGRELAADGKSLTVTLRTDDRTVLSATGAAGEQRADGYYYYTRRLTANGDHVFRFASVSGAIGEITVTVTELVLEPLAARYSLSEDGANAVSDPALLTVGIGDTVYVEPNRDVTAELSDGTLKEMRTGLWTAIGIADALGQTQPYIVLSDRFGNVLVHQFSQITVPDTTAPEIILGRRTWSVRVGTDRATVKAELMSNFNVFDNEGGEIATDVILPESLSAVGVFDVTYVATDAAGNETRVVGRLRVTSVWEPVMYAGETKINRDDGVYFAAGEEIVFSIDCAGIAWRAVLDTGIRTAAQMKDDVTVVADYNTGDTLSLGVLDAGTYTLCIVTQNRDYFRVVISVE